jgi:hypothetical protein
MPGRWPKLQTHNFVFEFWPFFFGRTGRKELTMLKKLLTEKEAAALTGLSISFFQQSRFKKRGPSYVKIGSRCLYDPDDLAEFIQQHVIKVAA